MALVGSQGTELVPEFLIGVLELFYSLSEGADHALDQFQDLLLLHLRILIIITLIQR